MMGCSERVQDRCQKAKETGKLRIVRARGPCDGSVRRHGKCPNGEKRADLEWKDAGRRE